MIRINGRLLNAAEPGKGDVFDGYFVQIDYLVEEGKGDSARYCDASDRVELSGGSNVFSFDLPDVHQLALDKDLAEAGFIREADFYKFRGRGVIQITFRDAYRRLIDFVLDYPDSGGSVTIKNYRDDWKANMADPDRKKMVDRIAYRTTNENWDELFGDIQFLASSVKVFSDYKGGFLKLGSTPDQLNEIADRPGSIYFVGRSIGWPSYGRKFRERVLQLTASLAK